MGFFSTQFRQTHVLRSVSSVHPGHVVYNMKDKETGNSTEYEIPANFVLWSTGIAMNPFTSKVAGYLPNQVHKKAIEVDSHLRVKGAPLGDVYAIGDCATVSHPSPFIFIFCLKPDRSKRRLFHISSNWLMKRTRTMTERLTSPSGS